MPSPASPIEYHRRQAWRTECWFKGRGWGRCDGRLDRMHLIPKQVIRRELFPGMQRAGARKGTRAHAVIWDERVWRPCCRRHHGMLDFSRKIKLHRDDLPPSVEEFAREHGLRWWLDREYGERA